MNDFKITNGVLVKCNSNLKEVSLSNEVKQVGVEAFIGVTKLKIIKFPEGLTKIDKRAFYNCYLLREVTLPKSLTTIENSAFANCVSLDNESIRNIKKINPLALI